MARSSTWCWALRALYPHHTERRGLRAGIAILSHRVLSRLRLALRNLGHSAVVVASVQSESLLQTETCFVLSALNGSRFHPAQRSWGGIPASLAMRSSSAGHAYRKGIELASHRPPTNR